jgi:hypothetical protein
MKQQQNPDRMTIEEVISEIAFLQDDIRVRTMRAYELGTSLYRRARRNTVDDNTAVYITYANAITRFAGAVNQVLSRTIRTAKVLNRLSPTEREVPEKKKVVESTSSPAESLISSYIDEGSVMEPNVSDDDKTIDENA